MDSASSFASKTGKRKKASFNRKLKFDIATKYCVTFCRTGHCSKGSKCFFAHDCDKIAICKKFIYGKCKSKDCPLSHNPTPDKMPDCVFYIKGYCKVEDCKYRHVKLSQDAEVCKDLLSGYCPKGVQCEKFHMFLCKLFNTTGTCPKGPKCIFAHQRLNSKRTNKAKSDISKYKKVNSIPLSKSEPKQMAVQEQFVLQAKRAILNRLLTKRLKNVHDSNKQIISEPSTSSEFGGTDFVPLSTYSNQDDKLCDIAQKISHNELNGKSIKQPEQHLKRKYFVIDTDEEKLSDYLSYSPHTNEHICDRPQFKIIPDFLAFNK